MSHKLRRVVPIWKPSASDTVKGYNFPDNGGAGFLLMSSSPKDENGCSSSNESPTTMSEVCVMPIKQSNRSCFTAAGDVHCSLPFLPPNIEASSVNETLATWTRSEQFDINRMRLKLRSSYRGIKEKRKFLRDLKKIHAQLERNENITLKIPEFINDVAKKLPDGYLGKRMVMDDVLTNGGGICCVRTLASGLICDALLYSTGRNMKRLVYLPTFLNLDSPSLLSPDVASSATKLFPKKIYQVVSTEMDSQVFYGVRMAKKLEVGMVTTDNNDCICFKDIRNYKTAKSYISDLNFSPYIPEYMFVTDNGTVKIVNMETGSTMDKYLKFAKSSESRNLERIPEWWSCHFASHPRCFVCTNQNAFMLRDRRVSCRRAVNLLTTPSIAVVDGERFGCYEKSQANTYLHYVASCQSLFCVDERYPNHPVLSWRHQFISPAKYCKAVLWSREPTSTMNEAIVLASRTNQEAAAFHVRHMEGDTLVSVSVSPTLHISSPRDFGEILIAMRRKVDIATSLLIDLPLHGLCCAVPTDKRLVVFQETTDGNIYYQPFEWDYDGNLQDSDGFKRKMNEDQANEAMEWLEMAFSQMRAKDSLPNTARRKTVNAKAAFDLIVERKPHRHDCPFCCQGRKEERVHCIGDTDGEEDNLCLNCGINVDFAKQLVEKVQLCQVMVGKYPKSDVSNWGIPSFSGKIDDGIMSDYFPTLSQVINDWKTEIEQQTETEPMEERGAESTDRTLQSGSRSHLSLCSDNPVFHEPLTSQSHDSSVCIVEMDRPFKMFNTSEGFDPITSSQSQSSYFLDGTPTLPSEMDIDIIPPSQPILTLPLLTSTVRKVLPDKSATNRSLAAKRVRARLGVDGF